MTATCPHTHAHPPQPSPPPTFKNPPPHNPSPPPTTPFPQLACLWPLLRLPCPLGMGPTAPAGKHRRSLPQHAQHSTARQAKQQASTTRSSSSRLIKGWPKTVQIQLSTHQYPQLQGQQRQEQQQQQKKQASVQSLMPWKEVPPSPVLAGPLVGAQTQCLRPNQGCVFLM